MHLHAGGQDDVDLFIQPFARQAVIGDPIAQHTAQLPAFFINDALMPHQLQIIGGAQTAWTSAYDGHALAGGRRAAAGGHKAGMIDRIALDAADVDRIIQHAATAARFTRVFTDIGAYRRKRIVFADQAHRISVPAFLDQSDIARDIHAGRTHGHTGHRLIQAGCAASMQDMLFIIITKAAHALQHHFGSFIADSAVGAP